MLAQLLVCWGATESLAALGCGTPGFRPAPFYATEAAPRSVATGDFNRDGKFDFAVGNYGSDSVTVYMNDGTGAFTNVSNVRVGAGPSALAAGDFNKDGKIDLVTANSSSSNVTLLLGDGGGGFPTRADFRVGAPALSLATGDLNGDGNLDLVSGITYDRRISILLGDGGGRLGAPTLVDVTQQVLHVAAGDFNDDKKTDLAVATINGLKILLGKGDGTFAATATTCAEPIGSTLTVADLNGDNRDDIIGAGGGSNNVSVLLGNGTGCFGPPARYSVSPAIGSAHSPYAVVVADINGDGKLDVTTANEGSNNVSLLLGGAGGTLTAANVFGGGRSPRALSAADFDGDGRSDVAVASAEGNYVSVLFGAADNGFKFATGRGTTAAAIADLNKDGKKDLAVAATGISILLGDGGGEYGAARKFSAGDYVSSIVVADFNADGNADVAGVGRGGGEYAMFVLPGDGAGNLGAAVRYVVESSPRVIAMGDLDGDGRADLVSANDSGKISVFMGNAQGNFATAVNYAAEYFNNPQAVAVADLNGDGKPEVALPTRAGVTVLYNDGSGKFPTKQSFGAGVNTQSVIARDLDGDGKLDIAAANAASANVSVLIGNGLGNFAPAAQFRIAEGVSGGGPVSVTAADFNLDGIVDLATANVATPTGQFFSAASASVLLGKAGGGYEQAHTMVIGFGPWAITSGDVNGDSKPDLITSNNNSSDVSVLLNACGGMPAPADSTIKFLYDSYNFGENVGSAGVAVVRTGDASGEVTIEYVTADDSPFVNCPTVTGHASARCDYSTAAGTLRFGPGETSKMISVPVTDDLHPEGNETFRVALSNPGGGASVGAGGVVTITVVDDDSVPAASNPIDETGFFVRQQYLDFLSREPELAGFNAWTNTIDGCRNVQNGENCDRVHVSRSFFESEEFGVKGFFVFKYYKVSLGRMPAYNEMVLDMARVTGRTGEERVQKQNQFAASWVDRAEHKTRNPEALTNQEFVERLEQRAGAALAGRAQLVADLNGGARTRAQVLRAVIESGEASGKLYNEAFVAMQYFGYLRRDPEAAGFDDWLRTINANPGDVRLMVSGFINSVEYRNRFGKP